MLLAPTFAQNNTTNISLSSSVFSGQSILIYAACSVLFAYLIYLNSSKFRSWVTFARQSLFSWIALSRATFIQHISVIVSGSAQKQMSRITTGSIITRMANKVANRYRTVNESVREARSRYSLSFKFEIPVAVRIPARSPLPAPVRLVNFTPKSFHVGSVSRRSRSVK